MKAWDPVKPRIYELYIGQGLSLVQVREVLAREEGFEACTRSYRAQISKWGWLKNNHQHLLNQHHQQPQHSSSKPAVNPAIIPINSTESVEQQQFPNTPLPVADMPHISIDGEPSGMIGVSPQQGGYLPQKTHGGITDVVRTSGASSPDTEYNNHSYCQPRPGDIYPGVLSSEPRRGSVVVILDRPGPNKFPVRIDKRVPHPPILDESEDDSTVFMRLPKQMHHHVSDNDGVDESGTDEEERRRYVKRQRHRSLMETDGVHEIRFDNPSTEESSVSDSSSPKSGGEQDDEDEIVMIDASGGEDNDGHRNLIDDDIHEREGDAARVLEDMKMYTASIRTPVGMKKYKTGGEIRRVGSHEKYLRVLNHRASVPVSCLSPRPPHSPRLGGTKSVISRVSTPFQRMASPFVRATSGEGGQVSGYLEILETIAQPGTQPNLNAFSKITDWLLILTNGISRSFQLHVLRAPLTAPVDSVRNLTILYHPQPPPGREGSISLGTIPTIHAQDPNGRSPLHVAIRHRLPLEIVKLLINLGGNIAGKDDQEVNCLHEALQLAPPTNSTSTFGGRTEWTKSYLFPLVEELLDSYAAVNPRASVDDEDPIVRLVNEPMAWSSDSPLQLALKHNQDISIVQLLIQRGAAVSGVIDVFGATPLHFACQQLGTNFNDIPQKAAIVQLLLQRGAAADINSKTADGHTPLHYAVKSLYTSPSTASAGGTPHTPTATTTYASACFKDSCKVVEMLIAEGDTDVSIRNNDGYAPVELASLALAGRVEANCVVSTTDGSVGGCVETMMLLGRVVKLLVKADRERYLQKEDEMGS